MTTAIIFDLGGVFINLDLQKSQNAFRQMGLRELDADLKQSNADFEIGAISENDFLNNFQKKIPKATLDQIKMAWNFVIGDFPEYRLDFLKALSTKYPLYLLSNTDQIHIQYFKQKVGEKFFKDFENCFQKIYFSFEIGQRKPNAAVFELVLRDQNLKAAETLFVDDKLENVEAAKKLGLQIWHLKGGHEDVVDLSISK